MQPIGKSKFTSIMLILLMILSTSACSEKKERINTQISEQRIVSLAPSITEMIYAIGAGKQLVGRTTACDWPTEAKNIRIVGGFGRPSLEVLATLKPDLVLESGMEDEKAIMNVKALGLRSETIRCKLPEDVPAALRKLGQLTGHFQKADSLATEIESGLTEFRKKAAVKTKKTTVYLEIWNDPLWTGGRNSFTSQLITLAGGKNIADTVDKEYFQASPEWLIRQNPDVIACMYMSNTTPAAELVAKRSGWNNVSAVKNRRIYDRLDNRIYLRPGPRILQGIAGMKAILERSQQTNH